MASVLGNIRLTIQTEIDTNSYLTLIATDINFKINRRRN